MGQSAGSFRHLDVQASQSRGNIAVAASDPIGRAKPATLGTDWSWSSGESKVR